MARSPQLIQLGFLPFGRRRNLNSVTFKDSADTALANQSVSRRGSKAQSTLATHIRRKCSPRCERAAPANQQCAGKPKLIAADRAYRRARRE
jgi:hypothetical protein